MKRRIAVLLGCIICFLFFPHAVSADEVDYLREKIIEVQNKGQLGFKNFHACSDVSAFGVYVPMKPAVVNKNKSIYFYYEPSNYSTRKSSGRYSVHLVQDVIILSDKGELIQSKLGGAEFKRDSLSANLDIFFRNTINANQMPPGKYQFKAVLHDKIKGGSAEIIMPFEIKE